MNIRQIQEARELFGIDDWGAGYYGVNDQGNVVCQPTSEEHMSIVLPDVVEEAKRLGLQAPMILRFPQIIESQLRRMTSAFRHAIQENGFKGRHRGVFPFKVNQRREFIDLIVRGGSSINYGLEVGSKTEFMAALGYEMGPDSLLIANGFKDREFIEMGFIAAAMGKRMIIVVEGPDELEMIIEQAKTMKPVPEIGLRVKLYSRGSGRWEKSSGESSKFGLTTIELLRSLKLLDEAGLAEKLTMIHCHIGSQITEIKRFKNAIKEASRVYAKIRKMGFDLKFMNIGGGVGVDYDGSKTSFEASANYSLQEFANDAVYVIGEVCNNEQVPTPDIVTESGRVIAAYHSVLVTDIREVQVTDSQTPLEELDFDFDAKNAHKGLKELKYIHDNINRKNYVEYYHDAIEYYEELFVLFNLGYLQLKDRAVAEEIFHRVCRRALYFSSFERHQLEEFEDLQQVMVNKYLANFSIFQSIPDAWAIDQLFPVMPLSRHDEKPSEKATIVDITCDSDGCLERFVDRKDVRHALHLHSPNGDPYYVGFFLVGAYQESLASEHNLFGAINEAEVHMNGDGDWEITKVTKGDPIDELLVSRNYDMKAMMATYQKRVKEAATAGCHKKGQSEKILKRLKEYLKAYPYLVQN